jgi:hypothetical protein
MIIIYAANEHAQFCGVARSIHVEYGIDLLFPRHITSCYKPLSKPVSFSDGPFTLEWVNDKTIFAYSTQNGG